MTRPARVLAMPRPGDGEFDSAPASESPRMALLRLKKRADFLAAAKGRRQHQRCFVLQARQRQDSGKTDGGEADGVEAPRFGFTVTKKVGNSVIRNRIRRRLREAVRQAGFSLPKPGHDYVLVARIEALTAPFDELRDDFVRALTRIHTSKINPAGSDSRPPAAPAADRKQDV